MEETTNTVGESKKKNNVLPVIALVVVIVVVGLMVSFANQNKPNDSTLKMEQATGAPQMEKDAPPAMDDTVSQTNIQVEGGMMYFKPNEIKVKKGEKVTITFTNVGGTHDFVLDEFNVKTKQINGGETETVEFTPDKIGSFEFYCSVGKHRQNGMKGTLIVE